MTIEVNEIRTDKEIPDLILLGEMHRNEAASHLAFHKPAVAGTCEAVIGDPDRKFMNIWVAREDGNPIGYAVAYGSPYYFNFDMQAKLELVYVIPAKRGSWAMIKLVKAFEEWARLNGSVQLYVGVARLEKDEAKHIRKLFPRMGYEWCGSYYLKEPGR